MTASSEFFPIVDPTSSSSNTTGWWQLAGKLAKAKRAMRALNDLRYQLDIVFPGHYTQGKGRAFVEAPLGAHLIRLPVADQQQIAVLFAQALDETGFCLHEAPHTCPTVLLFYSEEMHLAGMMPHIQRLRRLGFNVVSPEYVGYGMSSGTASESGCYAAAEEALEYALNRPEVDPSRVITMGIGIGGAIAADIAGRSGACGLILLSAFTSMTDLLHWRLPERTLDALVKHKFPTDAKLALVQCPVMIAHAEDDQLVPVEMSAQLARQVPEYVRHVVVPLSTLHGPELLAEMDAVVPAMREFIADLEPRRAVTVKAHPTLVMPRPVPMKLIPHPTDDPGTPEAWASEHELEPQEPAPSQTDLPHSELRQAV